MDRQRWQKIEGILDDALDIPQPERTEYVRQVCYPNETLTKEVLSLLRSIKQANQQQYLER